MKEAESIRTKDYLVTGEEFRIVWNPKFQCLQTTPVPEQLEPYYESPEYISHTDKASTLRERLYQRAKRYTLRKKLRILGRHGSAPGVLLDVGAGTGDFVRYAQERDWEAYGVEPNDEARELAHRKGVAVYKRLTTEGGPQYDIITLWHVFEHLSGLETRIDEFTSVLRTGGWLVLALPNFKSLDARLYGSYWAAYDVPRHLWHFSKESIQHLFEDRGFVLKAVKPMWLDAFYVSWLSENYRERKGAPVFAFFNGLLSNVAGIFSREFSSHIYILEKVN